MSKSVAAGIVLATCVMGASAQATTIWMRTYQLVQDTWHADGLDDDSDNDGVADKVDNCPAIPNPGQQDRDRDGVGDLCDNCPMRPNADQKDSNQDGVGDACIRKFGHQTVEPP